MLDSLDFKDCAIIFAITFTLSVLSYFLIEKPARKTKFNLKKSLLIFYVPFLCVVMGVNDVNVKFKIIDAVYRYIRADGYDAFKYIKEYTSIDVCHYNIGHFKKNNSDNMQCLFGADYEKSHKSVLLVGDSHSAHLATWFDIAGKQFGFQAIVYSSNSCAPYMTNAYDMQDEYDTCSVVRKQMLKDVENVDIIVMGRAFNNISANNKELIYLLDFVRECIQKDKKFVVLRDNPLLDAELLDIYATSVLRFGERNIPDFLMQKIYDNAKYAYNHRASSDEFLRTELAKIQGAFYYDPLEGFGIDDGFPFVDDVFLYRDNNHLNKKGVQALANKILHKHKDFWDEVLKDE